MAMTKIPYSMTDPDVAAAIATAKAEAIAAASVKLTGDVVQVVNFQTGAVATGTTTMPWDDTIPQSGEGTEFMTLAITPTSASNILLIEVTANLNASSVNYVTGALFKDAVADALAAMSFYQEGASRAQPLNFIHKMLAGSASAMTFKFRAGTGGAATLTFNGEVGARKFGGVMASSITITEIKG